MSIYKYTCIDTCTHTNTYLSTKHLKYKFTTNLHIIYIYIYIVYILPESLPSHKNDKMLSSLSKTIHFEGQTMGFCVFAFGYLDDFRQPFQRFPDKSNADSPTTCSESQTVVWILNAQKVKLHRSNPLQIGIVMELKNARKVRAQPLKGQAIIRQFKRRTRH